MSYAMSKENIRDYDRKKGIIVRDQMLVSIGEGDNYGDVFGVKVFDGLEEPDLSGITCVGYFIRPTGDTVVIEGNINANNVAYVTLPSACYVYEGQFALVLKLATAEITVTVRVVDGVVSRTSTDTYVDPGTVVPSVAELLALINECEEATAAAEEATEMFPYLVNDVNALTPTEGANTTNYGIHRWVENGEIRLSGQAEASRRIMMWNGYNATYTTTNERFRRVLTAGTYKFNVSYVGNVTKSIVRVTYTKFANEFTVHDGDVVTLTSDAMLALYIVNGENYGTDENYTAVNVSAILMTAKDEIARRESNPYAVHYIKKSGELSPDGYPHQAFPDLVYSDGDIYIISRQAPSHYVTTSDPDEYGGTCIDKVTADGRLSHVRFIQSSDEPYASAGVQYQLGAGCAIPTPDGGGVIMTGWTSDNGSNHSNYMALLSRTLQTTSAVLGDPFMFTFGNQTLQVLPDGKPLFTPTGHLLQAAYRSGNLFICRSNQVYGSVPFAELTFSVTRISASGSGKELTEASIGYCNDGNGGKRLFLLARNDKTRQTSETKTSNASACVLMECSNTEGDGTWDVVHNYDPPNFDYETDTYPYDYILHEPRLLQYNKESNILWFTASDYRAADTRNAVIGFIDLTSEDYPMYTGRIATGLNYGGYNGMMRYSGEEFDIAYYKEGTVTAGATPEEAVQSALMYKRISARQIVPKVNNYI